MSAYIERRFPGVTVPIVDINCRCFTSQFAAFATHPRRWGYCLLFMGRLWQGRHNSRTPCETCVPGFPPSPWEAVRKSHYSPYRSMRTGRCPGLQGFYVDRSASLSHFPPFTSWRPGGAPYPAAAWFSYPQYRVFSFLGARKVTGTCAFQLACEKGLFYTLHRKNYEKNFSTIFAPAINDLETHCWEIPSTTAISASVFPSR